MNLLYISTRIQSKSSFIRLISRYCFDDRKRIELLLASAKLNKTFMHAIASLMYDGISLNHIS